MNCIQITTLIKNLKFHYKRFTKPNLKYGGSREKKKQQIVLTIGFLLENLKKRTLSSQISKIILFIQTNLLGRYVVKFYEIKTYSK